ncbi:hypothetical protein DUI87_31511 [Hirundo rustica rustica]|uniref:NKAP domain containing 1 n=1 Tax=Hirundo rustica rustica TaxID=333673 RepID=A0A3M0IU85_HIRRU|nr:hypothetical protein DUI87_31511 [Hirundo rustica rustica]
MSRVPVGKVLLRNVIRHTGAHNKLQEETEMWKIREWEKQTEETYWKRQSRMLSDTSSSRMRSDGFDEEGHRADWRSRNPQLLDLVEDDLLRARSWNKKLYECEANMPDRWGHSGYKELYPEEFDTDSEGSGEETPSTRKGKHKRKKKPRKVPAKEPTSSSGQESDFSQASSSSTSSSEDTESEGRKEKRPPRKRKKRHNSVAERPSEVPEKRSKRKNWKVAGDEKSEDSSDED